MALSVLANLVDFIISSADLLLFRYGSLEPTFNGYQTI